MHSNDPELNRVLTALSAAAQQISHAIQTSDKGLSGTMNSFGEDQLALDVLSDRIFVEHLSETGAVNAISSEEMDETARFPEGRFAVALDPLDGSSLVDVNLSVGSIFAIFEAPDFVGLTGRDQVAAGFFVYGPRTTLIVSWGEGVHEYQLMPDGSWARTLENLKVGEGKMFAPGNLRAVSDRNDYMQLVEWWMTEQYTLRYSGGMVADINQILIKGKGIFSYPGYSDAPQGKLRLLYECAPMAYLLEQAGGAASDGYNPILDKTIDDIHQRTPIYIGSVNEVKRCDQHLT